MKVETWELYKKFFSLLILRYFIVWFSLVPVIAGIISQLPDPLPVIIGGTTLNIKLKLPFTWQILWISSFFYVCALCLYLWRCPPLIKQYNNYTEYRNYGHSPRWLTWLVADLLNVSDDIQVENFSKRLLIKRFLKIVDEDTETTESPVVDKDHTYHVFSHNDAIYRFEMPLEIEESNQKTDPENEIFYEIFGRYSESRYRTRFIIKTLLVLSLVLFCTVILQHIFAGFIFVFEWITA